MARPGLERPGRAMCFFLPCYMSAQTDFLNETSNEFCNALFYFNRSILSR